MENVDDVKESMNAQQIAFLVTMYRAALVWTQGELAAKAELTLQDIERVEAGMPSSDEVKNKLARAMRLPDEKAFFRSWPLGGNDHWAVKPDPRRIFKHLRDRNGGDFS